MYRGLNEFEIQPDATTCFHGNRPGYSGKNGVITFFDRIHFILAGNDDIHQSLNEFEIWRDPTMDCGVGCP